jgi:hypothetical protein
MPEEEFHPEQMKALRKLGLQRRLELSLGFIEQMRELRAAMLRREHPDWPAEQIAESLREFVRNAGA